MKVPFIIYTDLESLLQKINTCHNDPKNCPHCPFDTTKNKFDIIEAKIE